MNCANCGAALPPDSAVCEHCRSHNDVDLRGAFDVAARTPDHARHCPHCDGLLETLDVGQGATFLIERCPQCLGMFFDPGELEQLESETGSQAARINFPRLENLLAEETPPDFNAVRYVRCPTCRQRMNRRSWGARAGVIIDICGRHGIWLDAGELRRIIAWARAGGRDHQERRAADRAEHEARMRHIDAIVVNEQGRQYGANPEVEAGLGIAELLIRLILGRTM